MTGIAGMGGAAKLTRGEILPWRDWRFVRKVSKIGRVIIVCP
jgi:hypothetical protein